MRQSSPSFKSAAELGDCTATSELRYGPNSSRQQCGILGNERKQLMTQRGFAKNEGARLKSFGDRLGCRRIRRDRRRDLVTVEETRGFFDTRAVLAKSVPATAVIQTAQALSGLAGRKEFGDGY